MIETTTPLPVFDRRVAQPASIDRVLTLDFEHRQRGRLRARCDDGREVALMLERGQVLRGGTLLGGPHGEVLRVVAAPERVSQAGCDQPLGLTRAAYHLGNRHVSLQVGERWLRYRADHVLDDMVRGLGLTVDVLDAPFEPEPGAYAGGGHTHDTPAAHGHGHAHHHHHGHRHG